MITETSDNIRPLTDREFDAFRSLAHRVFGLDLRPGKKELVVARLGKKLRELRLRSYSDYYDYVVEDRTNGRLAELVDALTTNHTSFLREPAHFEFLRSELRTRKEPLSRIWSAACSSGEEPYSIAMTLLDENKGGLFGTRLLATDISGKVLSAAERGVYSSVRLKDLPRPWVERYFQYGTGSNDGLYRVKQQVRDLVEFRRLNLMEDFSVVGTFDVIFCRNVMIYFNKTTQEDLIARLAARLTPGGYLLIGHSESLMGMRHSLQYVKPAVYRNLRAR